MNVIGGPIDERGPIKGVKLSPIHADPTPFISQSTTTEVLEKTSIKVVGLLAPYACSGKISLLQSNQSITPSFSMKPAASLMFSNC